MKKIMLTNAMVPYEQAWGQDVTDLFGARLTRGQGAFSLKGFFPAFSLYFLAENLDADTWVVDWPTEKLFISELKKGYDFLGIQVKAIHIPCIAKMVKIAREVAPKTKIVLGGYGVVQIHTPLPHDPEGHAPYLLENADYICYEEGVRFFRKLIGQDPEDPITQYYQPLAGVTLQGGEYLVRFPLSTTLVALGCPNACEFCTTSAFFRFEKILMSTPEEACAALKYSQERMAGVPPVFNAIWDEDFLLDRNYVLRLGELLRKESLIGRVSLFCFGSIRSISQYTAEELVRCGIGAVWIGVESKFEECITSTHSFQKRAGRDVAEVFTDLHKHGILIIGSNILGLDFHDKKNIIEDIDYFVSLQPDMYQVSPLTPCPGTMLYERMREDGRIFEDFTYEDISLWSDNNFRHDNFGYNEIKDLYDLAHQKLYEKNGPSVLSVLDVMLQGYRAMVHSRDPHLQERAGRFYYFARKLGGGILPSMKKLAPAEASRKRAEEVEKRYIDYIGNYTLAQKISHPIIHRILLKAQAKPKSSKSEPGYVVTRYEKKGAEPKVVKRRDPIRHAISSVSIPIISKVLGLQQKTVFPIKLQDIDDFPATFKTVEIEGHLLNYVDEGEGEVLLMLHGNPTWSYLYRHIIKDLKKDYRCIALDHLGYGLSDKPPNADYSMDAHIRRLGEFVEKLGLKEITLICQDWGGIIGLGYAAQNKERFKRLIPMNTTGFLPETLGDFRRCFKAAWGFPYLWSFKLPVIGKRMGMDWNVFLHAGMWLGVTNRKRQMHKKARLGYQYPFQRKESRTAILKSVRQVPMVPFGPVWRLLRETGKSLEGWDVRIQIIWGMKDPVFVPWFVGKFEALLPNHAPTLKIPTASHFLQDDEPEIISQRIRGFLAEAPLKRKVAAV